ncbi:MAG TPA: Holliday junction resolvase RuvX [Patescibacteria group bacterium]|nr:Holliday junction resolvase RuvX [Patescibacteria group bacterium]
MALDYGDRRIGVALSDPLGLTAQPLLTLERRSRADDFERLARLAREHEVERLVVGLPLGMDGSRGERVRLTELFMERVRRVTGLPVEPWDERLTTVQAERSLIESDLSRRRRRGVIDQAAAVILLQSWLDARRARAGSGADR